MSRREVTVIRVSIGKIAVAAAAAAMLADSRRRSSADDDLRFRLFCGRGSRFPIGARCDACEIRNGFLERPLLVVVSCSALASGRVSVVLFRLVSSSACDFFAARECACIEIRRAGLMSVRVRLQNFCRRAVEIRAAWRDCFALLDWILVGLSGICAYHALLETVFTADSSLARPGVPKVCSLETCFYVMRSAYFSSGFANASLYFHL